MLQSLRVKYNFPEKEKERKENKENQPKNTYKILVPNELFSTILMHFLEKKLGKKGLKNIG
jgi:hypothetical protein